MKLNQFIKIAAVGSFTCALAALPANAAPTAQAEKATAIAADSVPVYIVTVSGKG